jgi:protein involved in polysaccharide export with SLBB domain
MSFSIHTIVRWLAWMSMMCVASVAVSQTPLNDLKSSMQLDQGNQVNQGNAQGAVPLRQPATGAQPNGQQSLFQPQSRIPEYKPGEFEEYVQRIVNQMQVPDRTQPTPESTTEAPSTTTPTQAQAQDREFFQPRRARPKILRLGADLMTEPGTIEAPDYNPLVPPDYLVQAGDELIVTLWGSVDADLRPIVDRSGRISIPRVGAIMVAGVRYADLPEVISRRVAQVFKNFQLSVSLGQLRGVRIYVTGFVLRPGAYTVSSLSTIAGAIVKAGGPSSAGSFRTIQLRRGRDVVSTFDFYDLLLKGDRSNDRVVQPDDVIYVAPLGTQVALIGSVNQPAIFELKPGETLADVLRMAGGFTAVADTTRLAVERLDDRASVRITQLDLPQASTTVLHSGDVLRAFNAVTAVLPVGRQNKRIRVEGEVARPGEYVLPPSSSMNDALMAAGGLTTGAFIYGTEFSRESVRQTQQVNYERALRDLELEFAKTATTMHTATAEEATAQLQRSAGTTRLIDRLRAVKPTGRIVLQVPPDSHQLPDLALEDGDRIYVPALPTTVGVFGSVFNAGSYLWAGSRNIDDYLRLAGGPTRGADESSVFVIRANGSVVSNLQTKGWFRARSTEFVSLNAQPGDTIFVPEEMDKTTFIQGAKDWTQILYQFGLGIAGIKSALQ